MNGIELMCLAISNATLFDYTILILAIISLIYLSPLLFILNLVDGT